MYIPSAFREERPQQLHALIRAHPLGTLVTHGPEGLYATPLPWLLDLEGGGHGVLIGHVARANPHWPLLAAAGESLVVFQGPDAYVSPNWYPSKHATGRDVPTWNYATVHVHGRAEPFDDPGRLLAMLERLTDANEGATATPWKVSDAPADYVHSMLRAIVGIRLPIARIEGKWKLSQNRASADRAGAKAALAASTRARDRELAALMPD
jgi:transcriptional regulator